jgi:hypothetical protein
MAGSETRSITPLCLVACFVAVGAVLAYGLWIDLGLATDGAYTFLTVLETSDFYVSTWSRAHSDYLSQWPLVSAVRLGVTSLPALRVIHALGLGLPFALSFGLCLFALRGREKSPLLFPLASVVLVTFPAAFILAGESTFMVLATWPILFLLTRPAMSRVDVALALGLLAGLARTYQTAFVPAAGFAVLAWLCVQRAPVGRRLGAWSVLMASLGVVAIGLGATITPRVVGHRTNFLDSLTWPLHDRLLILGLAAVVLSALGAMLRWRWSVLVTIAIAALGLAWSITGGRGDAHVSFAARTLGLTVLPALLLVAALYCLRDIRVPSAYHWGAAAVLALLASAYAVTWSSWLDYRAGFRMTLQEESGYVPVERTTLAHNPGHWRWTSPSLSLIWSDGVVRTIVLNRRDVPWEPFDPRTSLPLQRYVRYQPPLDRVMRTAPLR